MEIVTDNVNTMFSDMFWRLKTSGVPVETRNGPAIRIAEPVLTRVKNPTQRVLFHHGRDAPHIFHLLESVWMLAGRDDVAFLQQFNRKIGQYSDDGVSFNAPYGFRARHHFGQDQLVEIVKLLRRDPATRQAVLQLWDSDDLTKETLDKCCNMSAVFEIHCGSLNMTVLNRSNDAWYGYAGANIVHFTVIQEFVASAVGVKVGEYRTFTTNLHLYTELYSAAKHVGSPPSSEDYDYYKSGDVSPLPLMLNSDYRSFIADCERFCDDPFNGENRYVHPFFLGVAHPMAMISRTRRGKVGTGEGWAAKVKASDWRRAAFEWIQRREAKLL